MFDLSFDVETDGILGNQAEKNRMTFDEFAAAAESRSRFYWWLAGWLLEVPTHAALQSVREMEEFDDLLAPELVLALRSLVAAARTVSAAERETRLGAEFTYLIGGLSRDAAPPPPFESVWREDRLVGEATLAVLDAYQQAGFAEIDVTVGPQDHLAVELKFMSLLALREQQAWLTASRIAAEARVIQQRDFLDRHLLIWVPPWVARIVRDSREPFYRHLAELIGAFLKVDRKHLQILLAGSDSQ